MFKWWLDPEACLQEADNDAAFSAKALDEEDVVNRNTALRIL
jgi:hypothetical protein